MVICGGIPPRSSACYSFSSDYQWRNLSKMSTEKVGSSVISYIDRIWITGGDVDSGYGTLNSTEYIFLDGSREDGPELPQRRYLHCSVEYDGVVVMMGGENGRGYEQSNVWLFNAKEGMKFIGHGPDMIYARNYHGCGVFNSKEHGGRPVIVTAGGSGNGSSTSEFWDFSHLGSRWQNCSKFRHFLFIFRRKS